MLLVMHLLKFYGFLGDQHGNESYLSETTPFFEKENGTVIYLNTDVDIIEVKESEKRFIRKVEQTIEAPLGLTLALTGEEFANNLQSLNIQNEFLQWDKTGTFLWKLMSDFTYKETQDNIKTAVRSWMVENIKAKTLVPEIVSKAVQVLNTTGSMTKEDFLLGGIAFKKLDDEYNYSFTRIMAAYNSEFFNSAEEFDTVVSRHDLSV